MFYSSQTRGETRYLQGAVFRILLFQSRADELASTMGGKPESRRILWKSWLVLSDDSGAARVGPMMRWFSEGRCDKRTNVQPLNSLGITKIWGGNLIKNWVSYSKFVWVIGH